MTAAAATAVQAQDAETMTTAVGSGEMSSPSAESMNSKDSSSSKDNKAIGDKATTQNQPRPQQGKQREGVHFIIPPELLSLSTESRAITFNIPPTTDDDTSRRKKKQHRVQFEANSPRLEEESSSCLEEESTKNDSHRAKMDHDNDARGSIVDELLYRNYTEHENDDQLPSPRSAKNKKSQRRKVVTVRVGNAMDPSDIEPAEKQRAAASSESAIGFHNSAGLWILIWVVNNLSITLVDKIAFNEPVDFKYPYFLSAHHMAFIALGTNFIFWCLARHEKRYCRLQESSWESEQESQLDLESATTVSSECNSSRLSSSQQETTATEAHPGSKGSKELKIEKQTSQGLLTPLVYAASPALTRVSIMVPSRQEATAQERRKSVPPNWISTIFGDLQKKDLDAKGKRTILLYSLIFSANLCIGNVSIRYVSINFNQVMRSLVPAITIAMGFCIGKPTSWQRQLAVVPVIVGVAMACLGDMSYTPIGFVYTALCVFLAALKVVASGEIMTGDSGLKLHPFDLLRHMTPLALIQCLFMSWVTGEIQEIFQRWPADFDPLGPKGWYPFLIVNLTGVISLTFNVSSLQVNKLTSPLTLCVAANVKQVLMIIIATVYFNTEISPLNAVGIVVVLIGSACYSYISAREKEEKKKIAANVHPVEPSGEPPERYLSFSSSSSLSMANSFPSSRRSFLPFARKSFRRRSRNKSGGAAATWSGCCLKIPRVHFFLWAGILAASMFASLYFSKATHGSDEGTSWKGITSMILTGNQ